MLLSIYLRIGEGLKSVKKKKVEKLRSLFIKEYGYNVI